MKFASVLMSLACLSLPLAAAQGSKFIKHPRNGIPSEYLVLLNEKPGPAFDALPIASPRPWERIS